MEECQRMSKQHTFQILGSDFVVAWWCWKVTFPQALAWLAKSLNSDHLCWAVVLELALSSDPLKVVIKASQPCENMSSNKVNINSFWSKTCFHYWVLEPWREQWQGKMSERHNHLHPSLSSQTPVLDEGVFQTNLFFNTDFGSGQNIRTLSSWWSGVAVGKW